MNLKLTLVAVFISALSLTACTKKEETAKSAGTTEAPAEVKVSAEQQAAIDSVDQPNPEAIAVDASVVAAADAENVAAEAEKNGAAPATEAVNEPEVATSEEVPATEAPVTPAQ